jgi:glycosyltransferase involved in cell wall biosynthesis
MKRHVVLIPAFNEEKNIREVIYHLRKHPHVDIIVIDDGSKDRTAEIAKRHKVILLQHEFNKGKGEAIKTGINYIFKHHPAEYIALVDADMQYHPSEAIKLLEPLKRNEADFVAGFRNPKKIPYANRMGDGGWKWLFNLLFGTNYFDTNCGLIGFNRKAAKVILKNTYGGYIIENAIKIKVSEAKLRISQVPIDVKYGKRKVSKFARMFFGNSLFIFIEGIKYRIRNW